MNNFMGNSSLASVGLITGTDLLTVRPREGRVKPRPKTLVPSKPSNVEESQFDQDDELGEAK